MSSAFDITSISALAAAFMHLKSPIDEEPLYIGTGEAKKAVGITFHSPGSEPYEAAAAKRTNRSLVRSKKKTELTADILRNDGVNWLTDITASFDNLAYPPCNGAVGEDLYRALYSDRAFGWVVEQANAFLADWANFTKRSATS